MVIDYRIAEARTESDPDEIAFATEESAQKFTEAYPEAAIRNQAGDIFVYTPPDDLKPGFASQFLLMNQGLKTQGIELIPLPGEEGKYAPADMNGNPIHDAKN